ncbi:hypothetical protein AVEN_100784-1 [Araneus ventricosus]|uniref:Uncharacterized protein n=1 Tax=Araneus ventricosus TaxID=182803 RepID=A0A4Y2AV10_ARAVE|nr:hypothetical protein AVEN_100784-1 [Araneus ventricosus]
MDKASLFFGGVLVATIMWMWIEIFVFHEAAYLISLGVYLFLLIFLADEIMETKSNVSETTKMDKTVQTENNRMKEASVQTEDFLIMDNKNEENEKNAEIECNVSLVFNIDKIVQTETYMMKEEFSHTQEELTMNIKSETISPTLPLPKIEKFGIESTKSSRRGTKISVKKIKFLVPKDPNLFAEYEMSSKDDKVAEAYLKYIRNKHEEKKLPLFQRKMRKFMKRFRKT